ncbi:MAG: YqjK-like family protein [Hylemonella sp.]
MQRQQQLLLRSAELRHTLAHQARALQSPLALADRLRAGGHWLREHPVWPLAALGLLVFRRPRRILRWLPRLLGGWQLYLQLRDWLGGSAARKP